jgi:hypothetical protein
MSASHKQESVNLERLVLDTLTTTLRKEREIRAYLAMFTQPPQLSCVFAAKGDRICGYFVGFIAWLVYIVLNLETATIARSAHQRRERLRFQKCTSLRSRSDDDGLGRLRRVKVSPSQRISDCRRQLTHSNLVYLQTTCTRQGLSKTWAPSAGLTSVG